jgi:hypothetical protein
MSFRSISQTPRLLPRPLRGLGDLFGPKSWYIPLVEVRNYQTGARSYQWGQYRYINYWDAMDYQIALTHYTSTAAQDASMYEWTGSQWLKVGALAHEG